MDCVLALLQSDSAPSWENPITTGFGAGEVSAGTISLFLSQPVRREAAASRQIPAFKILFCKRISFSRLSVNLYMLLYLIHRDLETKKRQLPAELFRHQAKKTSVPAVTSAVCFLILLSALFSSWQLPHSVQQGRDRALLQW